MLKSTRLRLSNYGQQGQEERPRAHRSSRFVEHTSSDDDQELSQDEIRTLGAAGSEVYSIDCSDPPRSSPTASRAPARALNCEQAKRRRDQRNSAVILQGRTRLTSIDESSENKTDLATIQARHQLSMQVKCSYCDEVFHRQMDLDHHIGVSHTGPRPDVPRVLCADVGIPQNDEEFLRLTRGKSPDEFFVPPTLSDPALNDNIRDARRAAELSPIQNVAGGSETVYFTVELDEHHGPRLGPRIYPSDVGLAPRPTEEDEEEQEAEEEGEDDDDDDDDEDNDEDEFGQYSDYLSIGHAEDAKVEKKTPVRRFPISQYNPNATQSRSRPSRQFPSIASIISGTNNVNQGTAATVKPAALRQPLINDDESHTSCLRGDTSSPDTSRVPA